MFEIREATIDDAVAVAAIYAPHVRHGTATFEEVPPDAGAIAGRIAGVLAHGWPWLVAEEAGAAIGYAYAAQLRDRAAYRFACEDSIYLAPAAQGRGVGGALLAALIDRARTAGFRQMVAAIGDAANARSIALHARHGFAHVGIYRQVGWKFGRALDVVLMQRALIEGGDGAAPANVAD